MSASDSLGALIGEIRAADEAKLYLVALFGALALVDICAALGSENGQTSGPKFKAWVRANVPEHEAEAEDIYGLRCSLLHQGRAMPHGGSFPIAFTIAPGPQLHNLSIQVGDDQVGWLSLSTFIAELTSGAERWLAKFGDTNTVVRNLDKFARLRPEGLRPYVDWPVIA